MATQTSYSENIPAAVAGLVHNDREWDGISRNVETAAGIGFGLAVGRGSDIRGCVIGGTLVGFLGVSQRDVSLRPDASDTYEEDSECGILTHGEIWVQVDPDNAPSAGTEAVYYSATTGIFSTSASGNVGPVVGARWMGAAVGSIARVFLPAYAQAAA